MWCQSRRDVVPLDGIKKNMLHYLQHLDFCTNPVRIWILKFARDGAIFWGEKGLQTKSDQNSDKNYLKNHEESDSERIPRFATIIDQSLFFRSARCFFDQKMPWVKGS